MATSAFKSTTKRSSIAGRISNGTDDSSSSSSSNKHLHRRSRSLSRFSRRLPSDFEDPPVPDYTAAPRGKFVNTVRGSEMAFPEISLDDLAIEFFSSKENDNSGGSNVEERESSERSRNRSSRRDSEVCRWATDTASSRRRGRSVSRHDIGGGEAKIAVPNGAGGKNGTLERNHPTRRRSVSVARYQISDSESEVDHFRSSSSHSDVKNVDKWKSQTFSSEKKSGSGDRRLRKSLSQKDLARLHDGYSSHSSALTDDETKDANPGKNGNYKTIQAVYAQKRIEHPSEDVVKGGLYEVMQKELRHAVEEIRTELEQVVVRNNVVLDNGNCGKCDADGVFSTIQRNYATKLEQSQKRKQDLLAEMIWEEQRGRELSKIVRELGPDSNNSASEKKPSRARKRSVDKNRMSKRLTDEAERYIEDFISNVEDTDISSFDGERSDASSSLGGPTKIRDSACTIPANFQCPTGSNACSVGADGVVLPWLQWETSNDGSLIEKNKMRTPVTQKSLQSDAEQDMLSGRDLSAYSASSHGSWSPGLINNYYLNAKEDNGEKFVDSGTRRRTSFEMSECLMHRRKEEALFEMYKQQSRIASGGLLLCTNFF